ncbi:hypothetical protein EV363DRAFT_1150048 [Boletus edulis]|uniref:DUF6533 domain-containing protein n=1 Tax=Boletus edulis BED1 TaxID=1328754 RepID=A0AAD4C5N8_BOLED|nr:hypothetical protein EV363DRAFT_1150048 [Boletus edulis]KAF8449005.1 hypothetical protein L210DRAFT_2640665 [Boletus edulis BED1]
MAITDILIAFFSAAIESYELNFAFASLIFYEYILCFSEEVEYFWTGSWLPSRFLYLAIRYMSLGYAVFSNIIDYSTIQVSRSLSNLKFDVQHQTPPHQPTSLTHAALLIKLFAFVIPISMLCQSVITLRIWFLFSRQIAIKIFAVALLVATAIANTLLLALQWNSIQYGLSHPQISTSSSFAWVYVPSLLSHTILFALKVYRFLTSPARMQSDSLLWGFVKEGMFMYVFAMASLLFGVVGLAMVEPSQLSVHIPAAISSPIVALVSISVCRVMLSIRSVAATAHVDPEWLLNHAELSRVHWRRGSVDGEIIVEAGQFTTSLDTKHPRGLPWGLDVFLVHKRRKFLFRH